MAWRAVSRWPASISQAATTWAPGSSKKLSTLLPPCQPVPMQATVMRSLGATTPSRPSARPGMKAGPSTAPVATFFRKSRRPIIQNLVTGGSDHWDAESRRDTISPAPRISSAKRSRIGGETPKPYLRGHISSPFSADSFELYYAPHYNVRLGTFQWLRPITWMTRCAVRSCSQRGIDSFLVQGNLVLVMGCAARELLKPPVDAQYHNFDNRCRVRNTAC